MRFYATRTEAIQKTYSALQLLNQRRKGSLNPSRAIRVATLYGHLQCRAQSGQPIRLGCRDLANAWHLQPRELRADLQDLAAIGEKIRMLSESSALREGAELLAVTVSLGVTAYVAGESAESLVQRADRLLYQSKESGRNRITVG